MPRILVTNDDGVRSEGIHALAEALRPFGEVTVVAPHIEASAIGHALTLRRPLRIEKVGERIYEVDGTPTDCVNIAITQLFDGVVPDLVLSGINKGYNLGDDVTYSGTVAGAMEGSLLGIPSIAVSLERAPAEYDFSQAAAADVPQSQRASGPAEGLARDVPGEAESRDRRRPADRPAWAAVLLDRGRGKRVGTARPLGLPGREGRLRLGHAAPAGPDRLRGDGIR